MDFRTVWFIICACVVLISIIGLYQAAKHERLRNKKLAAELKALQGQFECASVSRDSWYATANEWEERYDECFKHLWEDRHKISTAWHAHQIVKKGKQVICLTAIVEASDGPGAVAAFEAQMKEVKAKMRIRSKAPVFAKPVFPNI